MIEKQIHDDNVNASKYNNDGGGSCCSASTCLGIEFSPDKDNDNNNSHRKELVACIMRHRNGSIGILHVDECDRRYGLGKAVLREAMNALVCKNEDIFAFILDGNEASEGLFTKLGWRKVDPLSKKGTG